jgi:hypothetical protein
MSHLPVKKFAELVRAFLIVATFMPQQVTSASDLKMLYSLRHPMLA